MSPWHYQPYACESMNTSQRSAVRDENIGEAAMQVVTVVWLVLRLCRLVVTFSSSSFMRTQMVSLGVSNGSLSGTFRLRYGDQATYPLEANASAEAVEVSQALATFSRIPRAVEQSKTPPGRLFS